MNLPPPWDKYLQRQRKLFKSNIVDGTSWGREAQLNRILASDPACEQPSAEELDRAARSEARRERHRARLRRLYIPRAEFEHEERERVLQVREDLRTAKARATGEEWALLRAVGDGSTYAEIATEVGASSGALRVRVLRLRNALRIGLSSWDGVQPQ